MGRLAVEVPTGLCRRARVSVPPPATKRPSLSCDRRPLAAPLSRPPYPQKTPSKKNHPHHNTDKYCGDACCTPALAIMEEMGVLAELVANNEAHFADAGGFVSPKGISYIGACKEKLGQAACAAVKRINLDARMAKAAAKAGAQLKEEFEVVDAAFDADKGLWTVVSSTGATVKGRQLVVADGATSKLATKLGYCTEPPRGVCTRAFVEGGTHNTNFDGVCFYPKWSLPGYAAPQRRAQLLLLPDPLWQARLLWGCHRE